MKPAKPLKYRRFPKPKVGDLVEVIHFKKEWDRRSLYRSQMVETHRETCTVTKVGREWFHYLTQRGAPWKESIATWGHDSDEARVRVVPATYDLALEAQRGKLLGQLRTALDSYQTRTVPTQALLDLAVLLESHAV